MISGQEIISANLDFSGMQRPRPNGLSVTCQFILGWETDPKR
jgi:hypothetical protein